MERCSTTRPSESTGWRNGSWYGILRLRSAPPSYAQDERRKVSPTVRPERSEAESKDACCVPYGGVPDGRRQSPLRSQRPDRVDHPEPPGGAERHQRGDAGADHRVLRPGGSGPGRPGGAFPRRRRERLYRRRRPEGAGTAQRRSGGTAFSAGGPAGQAGAGYPLAHRRRGFAAETLHRASARLRGRGGPVDRHGLRHPHRRGQRPAGGHRGPARLHAGVGRHPAAGPPRGHRQGPGVLPLRAS